MKLRVLIADPDPDLQRTITAALSQERDMEAAGFSSGGTETLSQIQSLRPDVVLLELVQPQLDGLSVLRRLAEAESAPPVVVLTGFVNAAIVAECARLGAAYFIPKPCDPGALLQCLRQYAKAEKRPPAAVPGLAPAPKVPAPAPAHLESAVTNLLHEMGVPAHIKGFQYLRAGIPFYDPRYGLRLWNNEGAVSGDRQKVFCDACLRRAGNAPCDRDRMEPRRLRDAAENLPRHHLRSQRKTDKRRIHRPACRAYSASF